MKTIVVVLVTKTAVLRRVRLSQLVFSIDDDNQLLIANEVTFNLLLICSAVRHHVTLCLITLLLCDSYDRFMF